VKSKIIIANNFWHLEHAGGAYKISTDLAVHLSAKGYDVHYLCMGGPGARFGVSTESGVKIWRYPTAEHGGKGKSLSHYFYHLRQAGNIAQAIYQDSRAADTLILNGHGSLQYLGALNRLPRRIVSKKVMSVHSPMEEEYRAEKVGDVWTLKDFFASKLLSLTENRCYSRSDVIQCDSEFTRSMLVKKYRQAVSGKALVCPGYVDAAAFFYFDKPKSELRSRMKHPAWRTSDTIFFCLRRHVRRMGIDNLIRAAAWLRENNGARKKFRVIIGGDGPLRAEFEALTAELKLDGIVSFLGIIPEQDLVSHYQAADCFVLPTRSLECFGLILLETFACGTPAIATPVGSIPEVLGDFAAESLTAGFRPEDIGRSMRDFLNEPRKNCGALRRYAENFDKSKILNQLENVVTGSERNS